MQNSAETAEITYVVNGDQYKVTIGSYVSGAFAKVAQHPDIVNKTGEDRVKALRSLPETGISFIFRCKNGRQDNGPNGEPMAERFRKSGEPNFVSFRKKNGFATILSHSEIKDRAAGEIVALDRKTVVNTP